MIELVTLEEAKMHLRIDDDYGDSDLTLKIQGGSAAILSYIQGSRTLVVDDSGNLIEGEPLTRVQTAMLVLLGYLDRNRGGEEEEKLKQGELPFSVTMLIYDLRRPTIL
ncbi:phage gp6-like head-tail connector protein [Salmonella enterica subsp. enterica serovar Oranienburg]|uniref:Phage gp6-like head-tail connector protein n=1 Tax=Salmonella oranienberg TaxID=28147 RepID=A0A5I4QFY9_SALON|nr:phage gp6-like head-tail connector protein [Salmonella enterica subsp. enterica serovar Oranienburg]EBY7639388.1 phage gp6-like head-tail connector protein [Salmonella enterica subsp. enterica serovar Oranienburg]EBZ5718313.1 phage gp6-like head-tail connector protein [Salmonella enterica subsp. enterica serovar Oranienburg]ECG3955990.1 phage gp6-like head-tail connector protein [Salmonella enterica subsp. enterica serovar Oranienburg]EDR1862583.1 phage gp6-like head-tail connector protein [